MSDRRLRSLRQPRPRRVIRPRNNNQENLIVENIGVDFNLDNLYRDIISSKGPLRDNYAKGMTGTSANETDIINIIKNTITYYLLEMVMVIKLKI